jgi:signal transduction histidine kinase
MNASPPATPSQALSQADLAELLGAFNDATVRLQSAHERLQGEVARLQDELRQANEQLERSRRLAALGEMAAGIAHEIRNPLGSIRLYAKMLEEDLRDRENERGVAQRIGAAVRTVDAVVHDVLAFAKEIRVRPTVVSVDDLFTRAIEEAVGPDSRGLVVDRKDLRSATREIECDPSLMQRALVNIVANAVQAMREREGAGPACRLTLDVGRRTIADADGTKRSFTAVSVADSGPGIPEHVMERMFNPFFTTRATGTGLGLAIVHRIVDAHGGRVAVRNIVEDGRNAGAVVELLMPANTVNEEEPTDGQGMPRRSNKARRSGGGEGRRGRQRVTEGAE